MADDWAKRWPTSTPLQVVTPATFVVIGGALYLKLDQTTPQNVIGGSPQFDEGLTIKENKRVYLDGL